MGFVLLSVATVAVSQSLGVVGEVFPVKEESFLVFIESRIKTLEARGELDHLQDQWLKTVESHTKRPVPVGLKRVQSYRSHRYVPAILLQEDVKNEQGEVIFPQGTRINALEALKNYEPHWLFLDADDEAQVTWAKNTLVRLGDVRIILVGGDVGRMEAFFNQPIYFDQSGRISQQLGIDAVPALVTREKQALVIQEIAIKEDAHAF